MINCNASFINKKLTQFHGDEINLKLRPHNVKLGPGVPGDGNCLFWSMVLNHQIMYLYKLFI